MHHANHFYGHAHVMARYCGLDARPPRIAGYLQHGWNIGNGMAPNVPMVAGRPVFTWSDPVARRARLDGIPAITIGAVWCYLLAMEPTLGVVDEDGRTGTIWYPFHGWEQQPVDGDHQRLIATIREVESGPVTVCLYWMEHRDPWIRGLYEAAGFRVICHGYRGRMWNYTNARFLYGQLSELRSHRRVASNRLSSAIFYGTSVGCQPAVYGDPMVLAGEDDRYGGQRRIRRAWSALHGAEIDTATAREIVDAELGLAHLLTPPEIRDLFGWPVEVQRPAEPMPVRTGTRPPAPAQRLADAAAVNGTSVDGTPVDGGPVDDVAQEAVRTR